MVIFPCVVQQVSPTPGPRTSTGLQPFRNQAAQQEVSGGQVSEASPAAPPRLRYCLNHPLPNPWSVEKLSSTKPVPGAKKAGDRCCTIYLCCLSILYAVVCIS